MNCVCVKANKVRPIEHAFLIDQRTSRKMGIGSVDIPTSKAMEKHADRQSRYENDASESGSMSQPNASSSAEAGTFPSKRARPDFSHLLSEQGSSSSKSSSEVSAEVAGWDGEEVTKRNMLPIPNVAKTADRYDVSDTATAAIVSAAYLDAGL